MKQARRNSADHFRNRLFGVVGHNEDKNRFFPSCAIRISVEDITSPAKMQRCSATIRPPGRIDSRLSLPAPSCCLMKMLLVEVQHDGQQNREATQLGYKARIDQGDRGPVSGRGSGEGKYTWRRSPDFGSDDWFSNCCIVQPGVSKTWQVTRKWHQYSSQKLPRL